MVILSILLLALLGYLSAAETKKPVYILEDEFKQQSIITDVKYRNR